MTLHVTRAEAIAVLCGIGFRVDGSTKDKELTSKLSNLGEVIDDDSKIETGTDEFSAEDADVVFRDIVASLKSKEEIVVGDAAPPEVEKADAKADAPADGKADDTAAPPEVEKKAPKKAKAAKSAVEKDSFGCRVGSLAAQLTACLSSTPKTMKELVDESETKTTQYGLLKKLVDAGKVTKSDDKKFSLVAE